MPGAQQKQKHGIDKIAAFLVFISLPPQFLPTPHWALAFFLPPTPTLEKAADLADLPQSTLPRGQDVGQIKDRTPYMLRQAASSPPEPEVSSLKAIRRLRIAAPIPRSTRLRTTKSWRSFQVSCRGQCQRCHLLSQASSLAPLAPNLKLGGGDPSQQS